MGKFDVEARVRVNLLKACDPASSSTLHSDDDVTGKGAPVVLEPIEAQNLDAWCQHFGGGGAITTHLDWIDCFMNAHNCQADQAIAAQFPRAAEWLKAVRPFMLLVAPPASDPTRVSDAVAALDAVVAAIDSDGDDIPDLSCGGEGVACGTACCYIENLAAPPDTICIELTAPAASLAAFTGGCAVLSFPGFFTIASPGAGPCGVAPVFGLACGGGPSQITLAPDSACP